MNLHAGHPAVSTPGWELGLPFPLGAGASQRLPEGRDIASVPEKVQGSRGPSGCRKGVRGSTSTFFEPETKVAIRIDGELATSPQWDSVSEVSPAPRLSCLKSSGP